MRPKIAGISERQSCEFGRTSAQKAPFFLGRTQGRQINEGCISNSYIFYIQIHYAITVSLSSKVGDWVEVQEDYTPGRCSEGGLGSIIHIHHGLDPEEYELMVEECSLVDVKYMLTGWVEKKIPLTRLHSVPFSIKVIIIICMTYNR